MRKVLFSVFILLVVFNSCTKPPSPEIIYFNATFTDLKGTQVKEISKGETIAISSDQLSNIPSTVSPDQILVTLDKVPVKVQSIQLNKLIIIIPEPNLPNYKDIIIDVRINNAVMRAIQRLFYRPTITATVFSGYGTTAPDGSFNNPAEMTLDATGNLYVIDQRDDNHDRIVKVTPEGSSSVFAGADGSLGMLVGLDLSPAEDFLYVADASSQQVKKISMVSPGTTTVLAGSGTEGNTDGTGTAASFRFGQERVNDFRTNEKGQGLVVDGAGNIYVGEKAGRSISFSDFLSSIRKITPAGVVTAVPGSVITSPAGPEELICPNGLTINASNELVYTTGGSSYFQGLMRLNSSPALVQLAGKISNESLIDGTGNAAEFAYPKALQFAGGFYRVADGSNGALRRVSTTGTVITLAGVGHANTPSFCFCGATPVSSSYVLPSLFDANPDRYITAAAAIRMDQLGGIAVRNAGLIYLSDWGPDFRCIWKITIG